MSRSSRKTTSERAIRRGTLLSSSSALVIAILVAFGTPSSIAISSALFSFAPIITTTQFAYATTEKPVRTDTESIIEPVDFFLDNPCGTGETIHVSGRLHILLNTIVSKGIAHTKSTINTQDMTAVGVTTGDKYIIKSTQTDTVNVPLTGSVVERTTVQHFHIIHPGTGVDFLARSTLHITVTQNPDFTVRADVDNFRLVCNSR